MQPRAMRRAWRQDMKRRARKGVSPGGRPRQAITGADETERYTMETETLSKARLVRVTIEAEAKQSGPFLRLNVGPSTALIDPDARNVTVEDIEPPRVWTDGDVVQDIESDAVRRRVTSEETGRSHWPMWFNSLSDAQVSERVAAGLLRVLRYQAGE